MTYKISDGIPESALPEFIDEAKQKYGLYKGKGVDFTHADLAPIILCVVRFGDEILLLKRGFGLADAEGYWSVITGFIDEVKPVRDVAAQELHEELGLQVDPNTIKVASSYTLENPKEKREYIIFPCLVDLEKKPEIVLDREHTECAWITRDKLETFHILDDLPYAIDTALGTMSTKL